MQLLSIAAISVHSFTTFVYLTHRFKAILQLPWVCNYVRVVCLWVVCPFLQDLISPYLVECVLCQTLTLRGAFPCSCIYVVYRVPWSLDLAILQGLV